MSTLQPPPAGGFFAHHGVWAPGIRAFRQLRFNTKSLLISLTFMLPMLIMVAWLLKSEFETNMQARKNAIRQHVEIAQGVLVWAHGQETSGKLTRPQAQELALQLITPMRYDQEEYFWINDMEPRVVMHPTKPALNGKPVGDMKDPNGFALFTAFVQTVRQSGKGFVSYQWPKPGQDKPVDKISYVHGFEPWGWIIGTGIYVDDVAAIFQAQAVWIGINVALTLLVTGYLFLCFYFVMDGGLKETRYHLRAMSAGDLTTSPSPWGKDEAAELMSEMIEMQQSMRGMVMRVRDSSDEIVHSASEISSGAMDLSHRTEQAASNLEKSASSMEEISATVNASTQHTQEAAQVARKNAEIATAGGQVMREVVDTMEGIRTSSTRIAEIIGTIDGIAFQTNILALNAAVEAARAGEQGRGFAVVASEVRSLAGRSAAAAKEIKTLIDTSVAQVATGTQIVRKAGTTIEDIVTSSQHVNNLLSEIATGAREQNLGIAQIGESVQELDQMTQQNAALVEQTAAAAAAMQNQAHTLSEEVARFRIPSEVQKAHVHVPSLTKADFDFDQAIDAHRQWKVKLRSAIAKHEKLDADTLCRDDACTLGQWLYSTGKQRWGTRPLFTQLLEKHAQFHQTAGGLARKINAGQYAEADQLLGAGSRFSDVSNDVTTLLYSAKRGL